jgi:hypothetical protein
MATLVNMESGLKVPHTTSQVDSSFIHDWCFHWTANNDTSRKTVSIEKTHNEKNHFCKSTYVKAMMSKSCKTSNNTPCDTRKSERYHCLVSEKILDASLLPGFHILLGLLLGSLDFAIT